MGETLYMLVLRGTKAHIVWPVKMLTTSPDSSHHHQHTSTDNMLIEGKWEKGLNMEPNSGDVGDDSHRFAGAGVQVPCSISRVYRDSTIYQTLTCGCNADNTRI